MKTPEAVRTLLPPCLHTFYGHSRSVIASIVFGLRGWIGASVLFEMVTDQLHFLGFSISYYDASLFEQSTLHQESFSWSLHIQRRQCWFQHCHHQWIRHMSRNGFHPLSKVQTKCAKNRSPYSSAGQDNDLVGQKGITMVTHVA